MLHSSIYFPDRLVFSAVQETQEEDKVSVNMSWETVIIILLGLACFPQVFSYDPTILDLFIPTHYDLQFEIHLEENGNNFHKTVEGKTTIFAVNQEDTKQIFLNADQDYINVSSVEVWTHDVSRRQLEVDNFLFSDWHHLFIINVNQKLNVSQELEIRLKFVTKTSGDQSKALDGIYTPETTPNQKWKYVLNGYKPSEVFPCLERQNLKSTFQVTVVRPTTFTSLSNTPLVNSAEHPENNKYIIDTFEKTPKLQVFHVLFFVSNFNYTESLFGAFNKTLRVYLPVNFYHTIYLPRSEVDNGPFGPSYENITEITRLMVATYDDYFNSSLSAKKLDVVFPYRILGQRPVLGVLIATDSLKYPNFLWTTIEQLSYFLPGSWIQAPEADHNKFESIKGGLERVVSYKAQQSFKWAASNWFIIQHLEEAISVEQNKIKWHVTREDGKYAALFRMMEGFLGTDTFRKGVNNYIQNWNSSFADTLQLAANEDGKQLPEGITMESFVTSWFDQHGYPLVRIGVVNNTHVNISQEPFDWTPGKKQTNKTSTWNIPFVFIDESLNKTVKWLGQNETWKLFGVNTSQWFLLNEDARAFYHVLYDNSLLNEVVKMLETNHTTVSALTRTRLLYDYYELAKQDYVDYSIWFNLTKYVDEETEAVVWFQFLNKVQQLHEKLIDMPETQMFLNYVRPKVEKIWNITDPIQPAKWESDPNLNSMVVDVGCAFTTTTCLNYSKALFSNWSLNSDVDLYADRQSRKNWNALTCSMVRDIGKDAFNFFFKKYNDFITKTDEKYFCFAENIVGALSCSTNPEDIQRFFKFIVDPNTKLPKREIGGCSACDILGYFVYNPVARDELLPFISLNWNTTLSIFESNTSDYSSIKNIAKVVDQVGSTLYTKDQLAKVEEFVKTHEKEFTPAKSQITKTLTSIQANIDWMDTQGKGIFKWLLLQTQIM